MDADSGRIFEMSPEFLRAYGIKKEEEKNLVPFQEGEVVELKGCFFRVRGIKPHPQNFVTLQGISKEEYDVEVAVKKVLEAERNPNHAQ